MTKKILLGLHYFYALTWKLLARVVLHLLYPHHLGFLKRAVVRRFVAAVGSETQFSPGLLVFNGAKTKISSGCSLGFNFQIFDFEPVSIGRNLLASHNVTLIAGTHQNDADRTYIPGPITIGNDVWIGANVLIVGPCSIGDSVIIGANSYVKGVIREKSMVGGSPARLLKSL